MLGVERAAGANALRLSTLPKCAAFDGASETTASRASVLNHTTLCKRYNGSTAGSDCRLCSCRTPSEQEADPTAHRPAEQPRHPVPVRPGFSPVWNCRCDSQHFSNNKKPKHVTSSARRCKPRANPRAKYRNHHEHCRACEERSIRRNRSLHKLTREQSRQQEVCSEDQNNGEYVAADNNPDRFQHGLTLLHGWT